NFKLETISGETFFARIYEEQGEAGALAELSLLRTLSAEGLPMATPPRPVSVQEPLMYRGKPFAIYPWIDVEILCLGRVTASHVALLGENLAKLHLASPKLGRISEGRFGPEKMLERLASVDAEIDERERKGAPLASLREDVAWIRGKLRAYGERR